MVFVPPKDRVLEHSTSNSQTVFSLSGAVDVSFNRFSASMNIGDTTVGGVVEPGVAFKSGILTYSADNQITIDGTGYDSKGTFSSGGTKEVFMGLPAACTVALTPSGVIAPPPTLTRVGRFNRDFGWTQKSIGTPIWLMSAADFTGGTMTGFAGPSIASNGKSVFFTVWAGSGNSQLVRVDADTWAVQAQITIPGQANVIAMDTPNNKLWVTGYTTGNIYRVDLTSNLVDLTITTGLSGGAIAQGIAVANNVVALATRAGGEVRFYNATTGAFISSYSTGGTPYNIDFDGTYFWVANAAGSVQRFTSTGTFVDTNATYTTTPFSVFSAGSKVYILGTDSKLSIHHAVNGGVIRNIDLSSVGTGGHYLTVVNDKVYCVMHGSNSIVVLNEGGEYLYTLAVSTNPAGIVFTGTDVVSQSFTAWRLYRHNVRTSV